MANKKATRDMLYNLVKKKLEKEEKGYGESGVIDNDLVSKILFTCKGIINTYPNSLITSGEAFSQDDVTTLYAGFYHSQKSIAKLNKSIIPYMDSIEEEWNENKDVESLINNLSRLDFVLPQSMIGLPTVSRVIEKNAKADNIDDEDQWALDKVRDELFKDVKTITQRLVDFNDFLLSIELDKKYNQEKGTIDDVTQSLGAYARVLYIIGTFLDEQIVPYEEIRDYNKAVLG